MKKLIANIFLVSALLVGVTSTNSCSKVEDIINDISIPVPFSIPVNFNTGKIPFVITTEFLKTPNVPLGLDLDKEIKDRFNNLSVNNVKSAKLSSFSVDYLSSDAGVKLDAVKDARLWISAPGQTDKIIASVENNTSDSALNFTPDPNAELMDYLKSNQCSISLEIRGSENKVDQMDLRINSSFKIQVGL